MSKSLGNFVTIREVLKDWPGEVVRLAMLKTHYRQPIDWTLKGLEEASRTLDRWYDVVEDAEPAPVVSPGLLEALADDLNTPAAISELHRPATPGAVGLMQLGRDRLGQGVEPTALKAGANLIGLLTISKSRRDTARVEKSGIDVAAIEVLIAARRVARTEKNWAESQ